MRGAVGAVPVDGTEGADRVRGGLDGAAGFGLQADADGAAGELVQRVQPLGEEAQRVEGGVLPFGGAADRVEVGAPAEGEGGDGAFGGVVGEQGGQQPRQVGGVVQPFGFGPIGPVDAVFDVLVAESLVGEAVEGDHFEAAAVQLTAEPAQRRGVGGQCAGGVPGEPEPDAQAVAAQALADRFAVVAELGEHAVEGLGGVDVGAVGQVDGGAVGVAEAHAGALLIPRRAGWSCPRTARRVARCAGRGGRSVRRRRRGCATAPCRRRPR